MNYSTKTDGLRNTMRDIKANPTRSNMADLRDQLNKVYSDSKCHGVIYTDNTDKLFFGMCVLPVVNDKDAVTIMQSDDPLRIKDYYVEMDSKLFSPLLNLNSDELTAILLHEVGHLVNDASPVDTLRKQIDIYLARNGDTISITDSIHYRNLLAFGFSDALRKLNSIFFSDEEIKADAYVVKCGYGDALESAMEKIQRSSWNINTDVNNKLVLLCWCLRLYKNVKLKRIPALRSIRKAKALTPSQLEEKQLERLDDSLRRIDDSALMESVLLEFTKPNEKFREFKIKGLKGFESDYYEYNMIKRNITDQDEALYLMRQINTRISVIENYIETEQMSDSERTRWDRLYDKYITLRDELSSKLVYKDRFIGLQVNYPNIKGLDY